MSQNTIVQQPQVQVQKTPWYRNKFWFGFFRSNYVTALWNWFVMLAGKAAEAVLTVSVIYSCARLLPSVHTSPALDNFVFVAQMVALDIGGLSLRKLANQARKDGNEDGAKLASRVSTALISIMIANVVLSAGQSLDSQLNPQFIAAVEGILLIARAIMAVVYAHVIHTLHSEQEQGSQQLVNPLPGFTLEEILAKIKDQVQSEQQHFFAEVNRVNQEFLDRVNLQVSQVNQTSQEQLTSILDELQDQNQQMVSQAVDRIEKANSRRLEAVWTRLEQVSVTMESNPALPAVNASTKATKVLGSPSRGKTVNSTEPPALNVQSEPNQGFSEDDVNQGTEPPEEGSPSRVHQIKEFTVNHWEEHGSLPTLTMIMTAVECKKTLASVTRKTVAQELGIGE